MKKVLSNLLAALLVVTMIPVMAFPAAAADPEVKPLYTDNNGTNAVAGMPYVKSVTAKGYSVQVGGNWRNRLDPQNGTITILFNEKMQKTGAITFKEIQVVNKVSKQVDPNKIVANSIVWADDLKSVSVSYAGLEQGKTYGLNLSGFIADVKATENVLDEDGEPVLDEDDEPVTQQVNRTLATTVSLMVYQAPAANTTTNADASSSKPESSKAPVADPIVVITFNKNPEGKTVTVGDNVEFTANATATGSSAEIKYQWFKFNPNGDDIPLPNGDKYSINGVDLGHAGDYYVVASIGTTEKESLKATLTVNPKPTLTLEKGPDSTSAVEGGMATFEVVVNTNGTPTYQWYEKAPGKAAAKIDGNASAQTAQLKLSGVALEKNNYEYHVVVTLGDLTVSTAEKPAVLTVNAKTADKIEFESAPTSQTVSVGKTVTFTAKAKPIGDTKFTYQWYEVSDNKETLVSSTEKLEIKNVSPADDQRKFYVRVSAAGTKLDPIDSKPAVTLTVTGTASLKISKHPEKQLSKEIGKTATFTVETEEIRGAVLTYQWYQVNGKTVTPIANSNSKTYTTPKLTAEYNNLEYYVEVSGTVGKQTLEKVKSNNAKLTVTAATVSDPKINAIKATGPSTIDVEWAPVTNATGYRVYYSESSSASSRDKSLEFNSGTITKTTITGLKSGTTYYVRVTALFNRNESKASKTESAKTWIDNNFVAVYPLHGDDRVSTNSTVYVEFNQDIKTVGNNAVTIKSGNKTLTNVSTSIDSRNKNRLVISHPRFDYNTRYTVTVSSNAITFADNTKNKNSVYFEFITERQNGSAGNGGGGGTGSSSSSSSSGRDRDKDGRERISSNKISYQSGKLTIKEDDVSTTGVLDVYVNGKKLKRGNDYSVKKGSVVIQFTSSYLASLSSGSHDIKVEFVGHVAEKRIEVQNTGAGGSGNSSGGGTLPGGSGSTGSGNTGGGSTSGGGTSGNNYNPSTGR